MSPLNWYFMGLFVHSYASPVDQQVTPCASSKGQSDEYDSKPYSESEHSVSSCFTSCELTFENIVEKASC